MAPVLASSGGSSALSIEESMKFASVDGAKLEAQQTGDRGKCPGCDGVVNAKVGGKNIPHWAHAAGGDCDPWFEAETAWHRAWKALVEPDAQEVTIKRGGKHHRADICVHDEGRVIELQHSPIDLAEMLEREAFYGRMVWVFDGGRFAAGLSEYWRMANRTFASVRIRSVEFRWIRPNKAVARAGKPIYIDLGTTLPGSAEPWSRFAKQLDEFWRPCTIKVPRNSFMLRLDGFDETTNTVRVRPFSREMVIHKHLRSVLSRQNPELIERVLTRAARRLGALRDLREERRRHKEQTQRQRAEQQAREEQERVQFKAREEQEAKERQARAGRVDQHRRELMTMSWEELEVLNSKRFSFRRARRLLGGAGRDICEPPEGVSERDWVLVVEYSSLVVARREAWLREIEEKAKEDYPWWIELKEDVAGQVRCRSHSLPRDVHWLWQRLVQIDMSAHEARDGRIQAEYERFHVEARKRADQIAREMLDHTRVRVHVETGLLRAARRLAKLAQEELPEREALECAVKQTYARVETQQGYLRTCEQWDPSGVAQCLAQLKPLVEHYANAKTRLAAFLCRCESLARDVTREEFEAARK